MLLPQLGLMLRQELTGEELLHGPTTGAAELLLLNSSMLPALWTLAEHFAADFSIFVCTVVVVVLLLLLVMFAAP
jgi:hypothetical protein